MTFTLELTAEQLDALADAVAARLAPASQGKVALSVADAAKATGLAKNTIRRRIEAGLIPTVPGLSPVRIPSDFIARMMARPE
jgi:hypothetical protein